MDNNILQEILQRLSRIETLIERQVKLENNIEVMQTQINELTLTDIELKAKLGLWGGVAGTLSTVVTVIYFLTQTQLF